MKLGRSVVLTRLAAKELTTVNRKCKEASFRMALIVLAEALVDMPSDSKEDADSLAKLQIG